MNDKITLISGTSREAFSFVKNLCNQLSSLKYVSIFFDNANFLITSYAPLSNGVHMVLTFADGEQLHIEGANCGYYGTGPHASVDILELFGMKKDDVSPLIFCYDAVQFQVSENRIIDGTLNTSYLFYPSTREQKICDFENKIKNNSNYSIDLEKKKVMVYNPQSHSWKGFLSLISFMNIFELEFYIGDNSPLEGSLYVGKKNKYLLGSSKDFYGIEHVNIVLSGYNFKIICLIDRACEIQVIDSIHLAVTGHSLFPCERYSLLLKEKNKIKNIFEFFKIILRMYIKR